jgi:LysR family glycine cleavage system transcriptional activator
MVASEIAEGRLIRLAEVAWLQDFAYYLVYPEANGERASVAAFRDWIMAAASADSAGAV